MKEFWGAKNMKQLIFQVLFPHQIPWNSAFVNQVSKELWKIFTWYKKVSPVT